ncbi:DUF3850 domain-containing protein [Limosilactobacillus reuteri]|uniref:DUF3850 domain-containing protein n=1 Tax=Limosilactobacillus reuteri TaxID=1598 RepID=UPI0021BA44A0|nr:DUF3850 domain-containing protein [Limosilactobacillus reuteri]UXE90047.1 DUF3850 domain-containing protein [Limosilactobacillus reuteri]
MNEIETKSFEVIKVMITVLNEESGSKATIAKFYKLGTKKNGDKYITITGIPDFYKRNAESLVEDAITIKINDPLRLRGTLIGGKPKHNELVVTSISSDDEVVIEAQRSGVKNFEIRKNDRGYRVDDVLWLKEYDPEKKQYTGNTLKRKITYITSYKQQEDYVVLGTDPIKKENN